MAAGRATYAKTRPGLQQSNDGAVGTGDSSRATGGPARNLSRTARITMWIGTPVNASVPVPPQVCDKTEG